MRAQFLGPTIGFFWGILSVLLSPGTGPSPKIFAEIILVVTALTWLFAWAAKGKVLTVWDHPMFKALRDSPSLTQQFWAAFSVPQTLATVTLLLAIFNLSTDPERFHEILVVAALTAAGAAGQSGAIILKLLSFASKNHD